MINLVLVFSLIVSFLTDLKERRILNIITFPAILFGLGYHFFTEGLPGLAASGLGLLLGIGLLFIPFALGGMGAGDVKLLGAIGALKGSYFVFTTFIYMGLIGGVIAIFILLKKKELGLFFRKMLYFGANKNYFIPSNELNDHNSFPYGVAIVLGAFCSLM